METRKKRIRSNITTVEKVEFERYLCGDMYFRFEQLEKEIEAIKPRVTHNSSHCDELSVAMNTVNFVVANHTTKHVEMRNTLGQELNPVGSGTSISFRLADCKHAIGCFYTEIRNLKEDTVRDANKVESRANARIDLLESRFALLDQRVGHMKDDVGRALAAVNTLRGKLNDFIVGVEAEEFEAEVESDDKN